MEVSTEDKESCEKKVELAFIPHYSLLKGVLD